ncbi:MAG TPA: 2-amino-4-hydroxy-6-hydroxymethyldihydropteridine diphosphokinase [Longimicrobiales bacterium]|nr:2-amino-4-hydroxy-6-hydroxymethyldihydropteridine diphosphokinase [Longimicrobiales bacterium]
MAIAYLGLGSNIGDRRRNLRRALARLGAFATIEAVSSVYESEPVGIREQPDFWNLVVRVSTDLAPRALLERVREIERQLGRVEAIRNAPRTLDIDLLLYDDLVIREPDFEVPHPRMLDRAFVMLPLAELDPERIHPVTGRSIRNQLGAELVPARVHKLFDGAELLEEDGA